MKLSAREKKYIYCLIVFLIAVGLFLGVREIAKRKAVLEEEYQSVLAQADDMRGIIADSEETMARLEQYKKDIVKLEGDLLPYMTPDEADDYVTAFMLDAGAVPQTLSLGQYEYTLPGIYIPAAGATDGGSGYIIALPLEISCAAGSDTARAVLDALDDALGVRVDAFSISGDMLKANITLFMKD